MFHRVTGHDVGEGKELTDMNVYVAEHIVRERLAEARAPRSLLRASATEPRRATREPDRAPTSRTRKVAREAARTEGGRHSANSMILHELYFDGLGGAGLSGAHRRGVEA
jgi:hypothetical protein